MKEKTGKFPSANGLYDISYHICLPEGNAKGIFHISHGMCEYFKRYSETIEHFTSRGFVVVGCDHMGHGESISSDDDLGYFGKDSYHCFADDLKTLNDIVRKTYRSLPYILLGHSMGSFVVRDYITRYSDSIDGCILCGTAGSNKALKAGLTLCSIIEKLKGDRYRSKMIRNIAFGSYNKRFKAEKDLVSWLTREKSVRDKYKKDKYCTFTFTVSGFKNMFSLLGEVTSKEWASKVPLSLPVYIISGRDDPVGGYGKGTDEVFDSLNECELNFLKYKLYDDCRHELFSEINKEEAWEDVIKFCDEVIEGVLEARGYGYR